jgi:hypothetical protein
MLDLSDMPMEQVEVNMIIAVNGEARRKKSWSFMANQNGVFSSMRGSPPTLSDASNY